MPVIKQHFSLTWNWGGVMFDQEQLSASKCIQLSLNRMEENCFRELLQTWRSDLQPVQATTFKCASEETCPIQLWAQQNQKSAKLILLQACNKPEIHTWTRSIAASFITPLKKIIITPFGAPCRGLCSGICSGFFFLNALLNSPLSLYSRSVNADTSALKQRFSILGEALHGMIQFWCCSVHSYSCTLLISAPLTPIFLWGQMQIHCRLTMLPSVHET